MHAPRTPSKQVAGGSPPRGTVKIQNMLHSTEGSPTRGGGKLHDKTPSRRAGAGKTVAVEESPVFSDDDMDPHQQNLSQDDSQASDDSIIRNLFAAGTPHKASVSEQLNARVFYSDSDNDGDCSVSSVEFDAAELETHYSSSAAGSDARHDVPEFEWQGSLAGSLETDSDDSELLSSVGDWSVCSDDLDAVERLESDFLPPSSESDFSDLVGSQAGSLGDELPMSCRAVLSEMVAIDSKILKAQEVLYAQQEVQELMAQRDWAEAGSACDYALRVVCEACEMTGLTMPTSHRSLLLTKATCHLQQEEFEAAEWACTTVLQLFDSSNVQALFRRGVARINLNAPGALDDMQEASVLAGPENEMLQAAVISIQDILAMRARGA